MDLGAPREESFNFTFNIPAGFKVEEAPKPAKITLGDNAVGFDYLIETNAQTVKIIIKTKIKKPFFAADEYENLRQFFTTMSAKLEEQIVLTKIWFCVSVIGYRCISYQAHVDYTFNQGGAFVNPDKAVTGVLYVCLITDNW